VTISDTVYNTETIISGLSEGIYYRRIYAFDSFENTGSRSEIRDFEIDTTPPTATIEYIPSSTGWTNGDIEAIVTGFSETIT
jgi:hypothetical protein